MGDLLSKFAAKISCLVKLPINGNTAHHIIDVSLNYILFLENSKIYAEA